jgi:hypothetical protein
MGDVLMVGFTQIRAEAIVVVVVAVSGAAAQADTIFVDAICPGGNGSELDPYCSIQTAIDNAVDMDEILVAPGTYFETINFLGKAITLRSSDGAEVTIIDGTALFTHVVQCVSDEGPDTVLDGVTITGGYATGGSFSDMVGGGMFNDNSSPTVTNCTFSGNTALFGGGGMFNLNSSPTITDCTFSGNTVLTDDGGGMANSGNSSPTVTNCTFSGNSSFSAGGGMVSFSNSNPTVADCTFSGNSALEGSGMFTAGNSTVTNCTFTDNSATNFGGGMLTEGSSMVTNCTFSGNTAVLGGGISNNSGSPTVTNCTFSGNTADGGGGMSNIVANPTVTNCTFSGNSADLGGGMFNLGSSPTVINCTFSLNSATNGQALAFDSFNPKPSDFTMTNCIVWSSGNGIWNNDDSTITIRYSDVQGGWPGIGNIDAEPLFVDPDKGDFRLSAGSPCIDAGNNNALSDLTDTDLDGNPRFADDPATADTGCGVPVVVDMGAYEYQGNPAAVVFADLNGDGFVGIADLMILNGCVGSGDPDCCSADLDLDGEVGMSDRLLAWASIMVEFSPVRRLLGN